RRPRAGDAHGCPPGHRSAPRTRSPSREPRRRSHFSCMQRPAGDRLQGAAQGDRDRRRTRAISKAKLFAAKGAAEITGRGGAEISTPSAWLPAMTLEEILLELMTLLLEDRNKS